jgi:hypothetical protein
VASAPGGMYPKYFCKEHYDVRLVLIPNLIINHQHLVRLIQHKSRRYNASTITE